MPRLRIEKSIERISVPPTQFARDEQWLHLNWQRTQTVGECVIGEAPRLNCDLAPAPLEAQLPFASRRPAVLPA
jgi:hypothetical protein